MFVNYNVTETRIPFENRLKIPKISNSRDLLETVLCLSFTYFRQQQTKNKKIKKKHPSKFLPVSNSNFSI